MKLGRILHQGPDGPQPRIVAVLPDERRAVDLAVAERRRLERAGASSQGARRIARALFPSSMAAAIAGGSAFLEAARRALDETTEEAEVPWEGAPWTAPVDPPVMRDCSAFEQHLVNAYGRAKRPVPEQFYKAPVYYKMNPLTLFGPDAEIPWPGDSNYLDYELEVALVVGRPMEDALPDEAVGHLFGVTVMNDFSARDVQAAEMAAGLGPAKGKDFATSLGPWITTLDEVDLEDMEMVARVNGEEWSRGSTATMTWSVGELLAYISQSEPVIPGEVVGTGTVGFGSGLELRKRLSPGDVIELEIAGVGTLRNVVGPKGGARWQPEPKQPSEQQAETGA